MQFAPTILDTIEPPIPLARAWVTRYRGQTGPVLDLTQAVPSYPPHPELLARLGVAAASLAAAGYGPNAGDEALRAALAEDAGGFYGADIRPEHVAITAGCNLAFSMSMKVIAAPGDNVLVPAPWYFNHEMALRMGGVQARPLPCDPADGFLPDPVRAATLIDGRTRAILLISPNNPTGVVYPPALIAQFAELARARGLWLILDETYRDFLPNRVPHSLFHDPDWGEVLVHLYSFSKAYCIPGHRLGAVIAGAAFQAQLFKVLDTFQICPARAAQSVLAWAIPALRDWRADNRRIMQQRAEACRAALSPEWIAAMGSYFAYLRLPPGAPDALATAEYLAVEQGLMTLPGPYFGPGQERFLRLAFANTDGAQLAQMPARLESLTA